MPAVTREAKSTTSPETWRYGAITRATGSERDGYVARAEDDARDGLRRDFAGVARIENHFGRHLQIRSNHQRYRQYNGNGSDIHNEICHDHHEEGYGQHEDKPVRILEHDKPVYGKPFCRARLPKAETDAHRSPEQKDDIPGYFLKVPDS